MEPLHPSDREALKRAHPGLTDAEIDRAEELIAEIDELGQVGRFEEADELRDRLSEYVRLHIPRYQEVMREVAVSREDEVRRKRPKPRVFQKDPKRGR